MRPRLRIADLLVLLMILLPFLYLQVAYKGLPEVVPTHFNIAGKPNGYSKRPFLWAILGITSGISILLFLLMRFLPVIDPKKKAAYSPGIFNKIAVAVVLLFCCINCLIILAAQKGSFTFSGALPFLMGLFFAFMGNIMHSIKPNYFAGIRTPWTLESEETWRKTHQFGGKLWFAGGIVIAVTSLFIPAALANYVLLGFGLILGLVPVVYSYIYFKSIQKNK